MLEEKLRKQGLEVFGLNQLLMYPNDPSETTDSDGDGVGDNSDNCPAVANASQSNLDGDSDGDACDNDFDNDGIVNSLDDSDGDGVFDDVDAFPLDPTEQVDSDGDGIGDNSDARPNDGQVFAKQYLQTASTSQSISSLHILNTSDREQIFKGTLRNGEGARQGSWSVPLGEAVPPMGRLTLSSTDLEDLFGLDPWRGPATLRVQGESSFDLMSKLSSPSGLVSNTNCVREDRVLNIEGFDSNNMSYVRLINTSNSDTGEIIGTLYDFEGNVVGNANSLLASNLAPYQQVWVNRDNLADQVGAEWNGEALLEVNQVNGLKLLNLNYITDEKTFFNFSCFEDGTSGRVYLQTTSTSQNVSATHLVNTSEVEQQLTGTLYGTDGSQVGLADQPLHSGTIPSKGRVVISSEDIESAFNISPWSGPAMLEVSVASPNITYSQLSSGRSHSCVLDDNGVQCWGNNGWGQTDVPSLSNPVRVSAGLRHTCAIDANGVHCWGDNAQGQSDVPTLSNPVQVAPGGDHTCALDDNGVQCWGIYSGGTLSNPMPALSNPVQLISGTYNSCAIDDNGLQCWGINNYGQTNVPALSNPAQVSVASLHICAVDDNGVQCWGNNGWGQTDVPSLSNPVQVGAGTDHTCAIDDNGLQCWGLNLNGETDVPVLSNPSQVSASSGFTCVLDDKGVQCWGKNDSGQLDVPGSNIDADVDRGSFELMTKLTSPSGLISNTNCVRQDQVHNIGGFDQTDVTYVRFINIGDMPITNIRGSLYDTSGNVVGETNPVLIDELPAKAHVWRNRNQLSDLIGDTWNGTASLKIDNADSNLRLLNLNFINSETFFNFSCYETGQ